MDEALDETQRRNLESRIAGSAIRRRLVIGLAVAAALAVGIGVWPSEVRAVTVVLRGEEEPLRGYLKRESETEVTVQLPGVDGVEELRVIPREKIELLVRAVDEERLKALDPAQPQRYYEYAEELAAKRVDPEARDASVRLYLLAAYLAPKQYGRGALLGMTQLARDESEQRRFQAMAYLLDPAHDRGLLEQRALPGDDDVAEQRKATLRALRMLRLDRRSEALSFGRRAKIQPVLDQYADILSFADFEAACRAECPGCGRSGNVDCMACKGTGRRENGLCPACKGKRRVECPECDGNFRSYGSSREVLARILRVELALRQAPDATAALATTPRVAKWGNLVNGGRTAPAQTLDLRTLTDFDPRQSIYRDGQWVAPDAP